MIGRWREYGCGSPVTLVAHGLGATAGEARLPASGLPGTRVVVTFGSHADAEDAPDGYWDYGVLADELRTVAEKTGARQAIGVSMGAGALVRLAAEDPDRFTRLALLQPAALDGSRPQDAARTMRRLAVAARAGDATELRRLVRAGLPSCCGDVGDYVRRRVEALLRLGDALGVLPDRVPLPAPARDLLTRGSGQVLVVTGVGDPLHPEAVATETAAAFPHSRLRVLASSAPLLTHRPQLRALVQEHLAA
ncbi:MAG TPA: alpha/beta hydrolase [Pseudonocardiaceae bacterium]